MIHSSIYTCNKFAPTAQHHMYQPKSVTLFIYPFLLLDAFQISRVLIFHKDVNMFCLQTLSTTCIKLPVCKLLAIQIQFLTLQISRLSHFTSPLF